MHKHSVCILLLGLFLAWCPVASAAEKEAGEAAKLASSAANAQGATKKEDIRVAKLRSYLRIVNSPLTEFADDFVVHADKNSLDWKLVAAIAGLESTYGKRIPSGSYNAWGWGIFTGKSSGIGFSNWTEGIATVSEGLKENYIDDGLTTVEAIGNRYAASSTWASRIRYIMNQIELAQPKELKETVRFTI